MAEDQAESEKFHEWVSMYEGRLSSLTGIAPDTLACDDDPEASEQYWDDRWQEYLAGADAVDLADEVAKHYPPQFRKGEGKQANEQFRNERREARARFEAL